MGLLTGPHGVETLLKTLFPESWVDHDRLTELAEAGHEHKNVVILDGNVLVRMIPQTVNTFPEYVDVFVGFVTRALAASSTTIIVFDEPEAISAAKSEEQRKRDAQVQKTQVVCSEDLAPLLAPTNDDYDRVALGKYDPHELIKARAARPRFFDAVVVACMEQLEAGNALKRKTVIFDGIDSSGVDRPLGTPRTASMYGSNERLESLLSRKKFSLGEGDLKLPDLASQIQLLRDTGKAFLGVERIILQTIDTDSVAIELMAAAARHQQQIEVRFLKPMSIVLALRKKRTEKRAREEGLEIGVDCTPAYFACTDVDKLFEAIIKHFAPPKGYERHLVTLLVAGLVLCKSDFVELKGLRPDAVFAAMKLAMDSKVEGFVTKLLAPMEHTWLLDPTDTLDNIKRARNEMAESVDALVDYATEALLAIPRMKAASNRVKTLPEIERMLLVRRAVWVVCYWSGGCELTQLDAFGFPPKSHSMDVENASDGFLNSGGGHVASASLVTGSNSSSKME